MGGNYRGGSLITCRSLQVVNECWGEFVFVVWWYLSVARVGILCYMNYRVSILKLILK